MENSLIELCEAINELVDGSQVLTYYYMFFFGCLIAIGILFFIAILLSIPTGIARKMYLDNCEKRSVNKIYEYQHINIFNCWKYFKYGRKK